MSAKQFQKIFRVEDGLTFKYILLIGDCALASSASNADEDVCVSFGAFRDVLAASPSARAIVDEFHQLSAFMDYSAGDVTTEAVERLPLTTIKLIVEHSASGWEYAQYRLCRNMMETLLEPLLPELVKAHQAFEHGRFEEFEDPRTVATVRTALTIAVAVAEPFRNFEVNPPWAPLPISAFEELKKLLEPVASVFLVLDREEYDRICGNSSLVNMNEVPWALPRRLDREVPEEWLMAAFERLRVRHSREG